MGLIRHDAAMSNARLLHGCLVMTTAGRVVPADYDFCLGGLLRAGSGPVAIGMAVLFVCHQAWAGLGRPEWWWWW